MTHFDSANSTSTSTISNNVPFFHNKIRRLRPSKQYYELHVSIAFCHCDIIVHNMISTGTLDSWSTGWGTAVLNLFMHTYRETPSFESCTSDGHQTGITINKKVTNQDSNNARATDHLFLWVDYHTALAFIVNVLTSDSHTDCNSSSNLKSLLWHVRQLPRGFVNKNITLVPQLFLNFPPNIELHSHSVIPYLSQPSRDKCLWFGIPVINDL